MLDSSLKAQLQTYLQHLVNPVEINASLDGSATSSELRSFLQDVVSCSERLTLRTDGSDVRRPSFTLAQHGQAPRVTFAGIPTGHEFSSLVLALLQVSGRPPKIEDAEREQAQALREPMHLEVYMSLSCHNCPDVVQAAVALAALNPLVKATIIDGAHFQAEVEERAVMAVPAVFLNGQEFGAGRMQLQDILTKLQGGAGEQLAQQLASKDVFDVLVVGAGPAGAAAAVYAARKGIRTGVLAERFGGQTNDTLGIENYISVLSTEGPKFSQDLQAHVRQYGVDVMTPHRASGLVRDESTGLVEVKTESGVSLKARSVVLSPGARWRNVNVPGEAEYRNKGVAYCPHCDGPLFKGKRVAVIGGGNSGVEAAIDLAGITAHVDILEFADTLKADAVLVAKLKSLPNVTIHTNAQTTAIVGDGRVVHGLSYLDRQSQKVVELQVQGVFVQIGLVPNTEWLKEGLELSRFGEIEVDARGATSMPGVFAAGDATTTPFKQIVIAAGDGAKAALSAFDYLIRGGQKASH